MNGTLGEQECKRAKVVCAFDGMIGKLFKFVSPFAHCVLSYRRCGTRLTKIVRLVSFTFILAGACAFLKKKRIQGK